MRTRAKSSGTVVIGNYSSAMTNDELAAARLTRLDPYCSLTPRFLGVTDTNALLSSVDNDCRKGAYWRSRMLRMTVGDAAALYAGDHVYSEVYERLPRIARSSPVPLDELRARFETQYLPRLRFVTVSTAEIVDPQVLAITDPDDVPTGQLAKLIAPCVVFSEDRHLRNPGLVPANWREAARLAVELVEGARMQTMAGGLAISPFYGVVELVRVLARRTGLSPWLVGGTAAAILALVLKNPERRQVASKYAMPAVEAFSKVYEQAAAQEKRGLVGLQEVLLPVPETPTTKQQMAIILSRQRQPLLAREVQERIRLHFPTDAVPTVAEIRTELKDGSAFVQPERYRWQFGRAAGPWRGEISI